ncbi:MAG: transposase, partial [Tannerellaceae bacterium]|nr:transposase [Tannerellaceae bacterium]
MKYQNRIPGELYFVTTTVVDWIDIFTRPQYKYIIIEFLKYCQQHKGLVIYAWVLMTNHLHLIISSKENQDI